MDRKEFIREAWRLGIACGGTMLLTGDEVTAQSKKAEQKPDSEARERRFRENWVITLMENMEKSLDQPTRRELMGRCGRACARRSSLFETARSFRGDVAGFVATAGSAISRELCYMKGDVIHWGYPRCFCDLVAAGPARLPESYCYCSVGWVEEMFETAAGRPVRVELLQSVKRGAPDCRFLVRIL